MKAAPSPAGAYLSSSQTGGGSTSTKILLNTIDPGFPYTRLASGIITLEMAGYVTIVAAAAIPGPPTLTLALRLNGTAVATGSAGTTSSVTYSYTASTGDQLSLYETDTGGGFSSLTTGQTVTYLHIIPAGPPNFTGLPTALQRVSLH